MTGYVTNIERDALDNSDFRRVLFTGPNVQLVLMALKPGEDIGLETHAGHDQFIRVEAGKGVGEVADPPGAPADPGVVHPAHGLVPLDAGLALLALLLELGDQLVELADDRLLVALDGLAGLLLAKRVDRTMHMALVHSWNINSYPVAAKAPETQSPAAAQSPAVTGSA